MTELAKHQAVRDAAQHSGMINSDDLRMIDMTGVTVNRDGIAQFPAGFFQTLRTSKPHLFRKDVRTLGATEYSAVKDEYLRTARGRR